MAISSKLTTLFESMGQVQIEKYFVNIWINFSRSIDLYDEISLSEIAL
jgi:hypothetical protein